MQAAADAQPSSMVSVLKLDVEKVIPRLPVLLRSSNQRAKARFQQRVKIDRTCGWICRVSIPVPHRCERCELPIVPQTHVYDRQLQHYLPCDHLTFCHSKCYNRYKRATQAHMFSVPLHVKLIEGLDVHTPIHLPAVL
jgi:hypothetical protein